MLLRIKSCFFEINLSIILNIYLFYFRKNKSVVLYWFETTRLLGLFHSGMACTQTDNFASREYSIFHSVLNNYCFFQTSPERKTWAHHQVFIWKAIIFVTIQYIFWSKNCFEYLDPNSCQPPTKGIFTHTKKHAILGGNNLKSFVWLEGRQQKLKISNKISLFYKVAIHIT